MLFDLPNARHSELTTEDLSPDQRRTRRQFAALEAGQHPLSLVLSRPLRLHPDAAPVADPKAPGARCGGCRFRQLYRYHNRSYPKCNQAGDGLIKHSAAMDVRKWWPACLNYEPSDGAR